MFCHCGIGNYRMLLWINITELVRHLLTLLVKEALHLDGLVLVEQVSKPAPLHGRGLLRAELLVPGRQLRVVPPQLLLVV